MKNEQDFKGGSQNHFSGNAAEYLVAFDLAYRGYSVVLNTFTSSPYDVLADAGDGKILKIQVKSTKKIHTRATWGMKKPYYSYQFNMGRNPHTRYTFVDIFAFVVLEQKSILYVSPSDLPAKTPLILNISLTKFHQNAADSLESVLAKT